MLAADILTVKTTGLPSTPLAATTLTDGNWLIIVPVAAEVPSVAFTGADSNSVKVSSGSVVPSFMIGTYIVPVVAPTAIVSVPVVAAKSVPLVAVPDAVA